MKIQNQSVFPFRIPLSVLFAAIFLLGWMCPQAVLAQGASAGSDARIAEAAALFDRGEEAAALEIYLELISEQPDHFEALWNASIIAAREGRRATERAEKERLYAQGLELASKAMELRPGDGHAHYAFAVALGRSTDLMSSRSRIETAHEIKEHGYLAMEKLPENAGPFFLMGVWHSEVSNVSRAERFAARVISRGLPQADNETAETYIGRAMELDPAKVQYHLGLCEHFIRMGDKPKARACLSEVLETEPRNPMEAEEIETAQSLLQGL